jgi:hypothetical protein
MVMYTNLPPGSFMNEPIMTTTRWGEESWKLNGVMHRVDGPAFKGFGDVAWYLNGELHRENGPAVELANGTREWYLNGVLHREDGPAIEFGDGEMMWFLNGQELTEKEWEAKAKAKNTLVKAAR